MASYELGRVAAAVSYRNWGWREKYTWQTRIYWKDELDQMMMTLSPVSPNARILVCVPGWQLVDVMRMSGKETTPSTTILNHEDQNSRQDEGLIP